MSLPSYLSKIKSAGIYRFVFDKSEVPGQDAETMRLVVGYSEKGPFNTPVYIEKITEFETIFGGINKKLERRGCYFHRLAEQALGSGPILALNLKPFGTNPSHPENVGAALFDVQERIVDEETEIGIEDIYNTTRFWYLEPEGLCQRIAEKKNPGNPVQKYISISATDSSETTKSVFMRGYRPSGYDVSIREWYASVLNGEEIPSFLTGHEFDNVSDYFAEIYVFSGEFTPEIASSEALSKYFNVDGEQVTLKPYILNAFGEKKDTLAELAADPNSGFVASYSGTLLPNFQSPNGSYISLDLLFNADNDLHKMMMNLNIDALYDGDVTVDKLNITGCRQVAEQVGGGSTVGNSSITGMSISESNPTVSHATYARDDVDGEYAWTYSDPEPETYTEPNFYLYDIPTDGTSFYMNTMTTEPYVSEIASEGDKFIVLNGRGRPDPVTLVSKNEYYKEIPVPEELTQATIDGLGSTPIALQALNTTYDLDQDGINNVVIRTSDNNLSDDFQIVFYSSSESGGVTTYAEEGRALGSQFVKSTDQSGVKFTWGAPSSMSAIVHGENKTWIVYSDVEANYSIEIVNSVASQNAININFAEPELKLDLVFDKPINGLFNNELIKYNYPCYVTCKGLEPNVFGGYKYGLDLPSSDMMDKLNWQKEILGTLTKYDGIRLALTNRTDLEYHYLVDTFESFVEAECKSTLGVIAKEKDNCLALVNFPAMSTFKNCKYSSFTDKNGKFQTKYIAEGCNKQKPAAVTFSLMSEFNGASFVSYNTPVVLSDGTLKTVCPSAALVSNDFMAKYDTRFPYSIVAGPTYGRIIVPGLVGPDFNYSRADLDILEPMGVNCMVYVPRKGTYINSNQTAKQNPVTALSKINVRELVIFLQDEIENLLQNYQWEFNTQELRDTIKSKADTICETVKLNGGLYEYINVCDDSNNTPEVIDNEMIILDTSIEPGRGAGKMVQRLYIYKTGGLKAVMA